MNICFTGVGSIALRHIRNLKELYGTDIKITAVRSGKGKKLSDDEARLIDKVIYGFDEMEPFYDAVFITNPTSEHYETLRKTLDKSDSFFVEKPAFVTGDEDCSAFDKPGKKFYIACPLRYSGVIEYIKKEIDFSDVFSIRCISSSYLPEWRQGIDYRNTYSASKELGGGVSIDLIHEWDYLSYLLGFPVKVKSLISKKSDLDIDSDDIAVYIAEYPGLIAELHLDYFGRTAMRKIELFLKNDTITCDLISQKIYYNVEGKTIELNESRDDYQKKELEHFMNIATGKIKSDNDLEYACKVLRLARGVL